MNDIRRQFRAAAVLMLIILPVGITGFVIIEKLSILEATWLVIITLTTIGYGNITAQTELGRIFTLGLVLTGLGGIGFLLSSSFALLFSPEAMARRRQRRIRRKILSLSNHYIICGMGEMVDKTIGYILRGAQIRRQQYEESRYKPIDRILTVLLGPAEKSRLPRLRALLRRLFMLCLRRFATHTTLLDLLVVVTSDADYADRLHSAGLFVVEGDPTDDDTLLAAGLHRSQALMVMLSQDTDSLLTVLTARNLHPTLYISAAAIEEDLKVKITRAGANIVLAPYEEAAQFLNSATLRPAVNDYFSQMLFDQQINYQITQLELREDSPWIGGRLNDLQLRSRFDAGIIGIWRDDSNFVYAPSGTRILSEDEILLAVAPGLMIPRLRNDCHPNRYDERRFSDMQHLVPSRELKRLDETLNLRESAAAIDSMAKHFVICGTDHIIQSAVRFLDPSRPFVLISDDDATTQEWLQRGFRVVHGNPTKEETLNQAGVARSQAIMISMQDKAAAVLTVLSARTISKSLLISVTATTDDMIEKLQRSGADRVVSPFHVAGQFVLLATTRPKISSFLQHVLYNERTGLETAELYMEDDSPWIGRTIEVLQLQLRFRAGVIGIRRADGKTFIYAPEPSHVIREHEVLIVITPMKYFDEMRANATGHRDKRPATLRTKSDISTANTWSRDMIRELIQQQDDS